MNNFFVSEHEKKWLNGGDAVLMDDLVETEREIVEWYATNDPGFFEPVDPENPDSPLWADMM